MSIGRKPRAVNRFFPVADLCNFCGTTRRGGSTLEVIQSERNCREQNGCTSYDIFCVRRFHRRLYWYDASGTARHFRDRLLNCLYSTRRNSPRAAIPLQALQVRTHVPRGLVAEVTVFFQSLVDDFFKPWRYVRIQSNRSNRRAVQNRVSNHSGCLSAKG